MSGIAVFPEELRVNGAMAEPPPNLTDDESAGGLTDSDVGEMDATSDYGSGEQQHVSDQSEEESSYGSDDDEEEDGDYGEGGEVMQDALATQDSDAVREEGNTLFKEKKVWRFSWIRLAT